MLSLFDEGAPPPCPRPFNMAAHVLAEAAADPGKCALCVAGDGRGHEMSFRALEAAVRGTATGLRETGLQPGEIIVLRLGNTPDFPIAYLGAIAAGLVPVPTSTQLREPEVAAILEELRPGAVLRDPGIVSAPHRREIPLALLQQMQSLPPAAYDMGDPGRLAYIVYTSGTSGRPRAVGHAHRAIWARRMMIDGWADLKPADRLLHAGAFNWTYTMGTGLMDPWSVGATAIVPAPGTEPEALPDLIRQSGATIFAAAPGVYRRMLKSETALDAPRLRHGLSAGETLSPRIRNAWERLSGTPVFEAYGLSECSTFISSHPGRPAEPGTAGRPQTGRRVAVLGAQGPVARGEEGEIAVHRDDPGLMLGYVNAGKALEPARTGAWFLTGDRAVMTAQGDIRILGRGDDMMNAGGYRVSPMEVEAVLSTCPGVEAAGVTEIAVSADARIIVAFYTGQTELDEGTLAAYVEARLARYKCPRAFVHLEALPTGANGKLSRRALKPLFKGERT